MSTGIDEPVAMQKALGVYYYHYDGLGSVVALSDKYGSLKEKYEYDVFGRVTIRDSQDQIIGASAYGNPYTFTGRRLDDESGLYYYRYRYYNADLGRFLQTDPLGYAYSLNVYEYCLNNPLNWIDPWGLCKEPVPLNREEFEERVKDAIDEILRRPRSGGWDPRNYYRGGDSDFFGDHTLYNYMGHIYSGDELNYYIQGILQGHYRIPPYNSIILPFLHNLFSHGHFPTSGEYIMTELGRQEYDDWVFQAGPPNTGGGDEQCQGRQRR